MGRSGREDTARTNNLEPHLSAGSATVSVLVELSLMRESHNPEHSLRYILLKLGGNTPA